MRHRIDIVCILLAVAVVTAACGGGGGGQPGGGPSGGGTGGGTVSVTEKEWAITFASAELPAGAVTLQVKNDGAVEHNFVIKETGQRVEGIQPGQAKSVSITLKPGTYTIVCDIAGHEEAGMKTTITVK